jgi:hypothetical protein
VEIFVRGREANHAQSGKPSALAVQCGERRRLFDPSLNLCE